MVHSLSILTIPISCVKVVFLVNNLENAFYMKQDTEQKSPLNLFTKMYADPLSPHHLVRINIF